MDEPRTRKEVADAGRSADDADTGAWLYLRGVDAIRVVRGFLRGAALRDWLWLLLGGIALWRFWFVPDYLRDIAAIGRAIEQLLRRP